MTSREQLAATFPISTFHGDTQKLLIDFVLEREAQAKREVLLELKNRVFEQAQRGEIGTTPHGRALQWLNTIDNLYIVDLVGSTDE